MNIHSFSCVENVALGRSPRQRFSALKNRAWGSAREYFWCREFAATD
jgi:hypothetical protein